MKLIGKVISFDGYTGKIIGMDKNEYLILKQDLISSLNVNDFVMFEPEIFDDLELKKNIARFITVIKNKF